MDKEQKATAAAGGDVKKKTSAAQRRANDKWDAKNLSRYTVAIPHNLKETVDGLASSIGETTNRFTRKALEERVDRLSS